MKLDTDLFLIIFTFISFIIALTSVLIVSREGVLRRYKYEENYRYNSELEKIRYDIEKQMYQLNDKLLASEKRWQDVNHLLISSQNIIDFKTDYRIDNDNFNFLRNAGIDVDKINLEKNLVFYLTPFHELKNETYYAVKDTCEELNLILKRGDEIYLEKKNILTNILENILKARLLIVNIDGRNPNVYYELGIAHALNKPTILISNDINSVPFDLKSNYIILYDTNIDLKTRLKKALTDTIINL